MSKLSGFPVHLFEDNDQCLPAWRRVAGSSHTLVHLDGHSDFSWDPAENPHVTHMGNFIYHAVADGFISSFYWVVPDPMWDSSLERQHILDELLGFKQQRPEAASDVDVSEQSFQMRLLNTRLTVCSWSSLPKFKQPVLLDLDIDYFFTYEAVGRSPYYQDHRKPAWLSLSDFWERWQQANISISAMTLCYSINGGYTPIAYKYWGDWLAEAFRNGNTPSTPQPATTSAAYAYQRATESWNRQDWKHAQRWWTRMMERDAAYRCVYATSAFREEIVGSWVSAYTLYQETLRVDPTWFLAYLGRGRLLTRVGRWVDAEKDFLEARRLSGGKTSAHYWLGRCALERGAPQEAKHHFLNAISQDPRDTFSQLELAKLIRQRRTLMTPSAHPMNTRFERFPDVVTRRVAGEVILVPVSRRVQEEPALFTLDEVAAFLWERLNPSRSGEELVQELLSAYDVEVTQAVTDVQQFLTDLQEVGVIRPVSEAVVSA